MLFIIVHFEHIKGIQYSYKGGNGVANVKCYLSCQTVDYRAKMHFLSKHVAWKCVPGPLLSKMTFGLIMYKDYVYNFFN